ncbi:carbohydrate ABC transporter permease [Crossiella cryophila]|uniref:N,N'-diacetylchitobiose transport system permease protein n=1 Tax=Crossiella cryophila TaxID=43355 RepID=A0A7W7FSH5_9PSEU|nr:carbohydrate ABC transporter permease [Crossiella cryophila]MBB4675413.1 N,N'-diacetylchitobiose transport system permease protein [Crossiella cryophila]
MRTKNRAQRTLLTGVALLLAGLFFFPTYWMINSSLRPSNANLTTEYDLFPTSITFDNFVTAVTRPGFTNFLTNSLIVAVGAMLCAVAAGILAAIPLCRLRFRGRRGFVLLVLIAQLAPLEALLIPMYLLMRDVGLLNMLPALLLVNVATTLPFTIWTLRGFVNGIPVDLEEAAMVDGCSRWGAFRRVTLPLLGPALVSTSVFSFITAWNEFLFALVLMRDQSNQTLPVWLSTFSTVFGTDWGGTMAASVVFALPVLIYFLIVQRNLVAGNTAGAVKG